jgi:hypothetical protein
MTWRNKWREAQLQPAQAMNDDNEFEEGEEKGYCRRDATLLRWRLTSVGRYWGMCRAGRAIMAWQGNADLMAKLAVGA